MPTPIASPPSRPAAVGLPASEITVAAATELPDSPAQSSSEGGFSLRVNARLVDIGVVAYDKKGHPITETESGGLRKSYHNGRKQTVRFFGRTGDASPEPATNSPGAVGAACLFATAASPRAQAARKATPPFC